MPVTYSRLQKPTNERTQTYTHESNGTAAPHTAFTRYRIVRVDKPISGYVSMLQKIEPATLAASAGRQTIGSYTISVDISPRKVPSNRSMMIINDETRRHKVNEGSGLCWEKWHVIIAGDNNTSELSLGPCPIWPL